MRNRKRFQCKTDLKLWRQMSKLSKEEVAESIFCSTRTIERIEKENATPNEETAKRLSDLYKIKFGDQFYVINKDEEEWLNIIQQIKHCFIRQIKTGPAECLTMV